MWHLSQLTGLTLTAPYCVWPNMGLVVAQAQTQAHLYGQEGKVLPPVRFIYNMNFTNFKIGSALPHLSTPMLFMRMLSSHAAHTGAL